MRWITCTVAALAITLPTTTRAQQWTPEQQEIWDFERACWSSQELESIMSCFHDDFLGWGLGSTVPTSKADRRPFFARSFETEEQVFLNLKPLAINVHGNVATVLYLATTTTKNKATGEETTVTERWTDICLREGDTWTWIADHGVRVSDN
jgi:hypothetical protein